MSDLRYRASSRLKSWRENPAQFYHENFQIELDEWQVDAANALGGGLTPVRRVGFKACTGPGKTLILGAEGWRRLSCYGGKNQHPKGAALSISRDNLQDNLWAEMATLQKRSEFLSQEFTWTKQKIYANDHPETWFLSARSFAKDADESTIGNALSGLHGPFPFVLLDEIGDMPTAVGRKAEQIFTGSPIDAVIVAAGNPTSVNGLLYEICNRLRSEWKIITITADPDDPKRTPRISIEFARKQISLYGRENPWIMATILGLFPSAGFNSLVGIEDIEAAMNRHVREENYSFAPKILGVDVAREGNDRSVIAPRQGLVGFRPKIFRNLRSNILAGHVSQAEDKWQADGTIVDGTGGWGSGVIDAGATMGRTWFDCQFSGKPFNPRYANKRAEICFEFAEWIKNGGALPHMPELIAEATAITYSFQGDRFIVTPKEIIKKTLGVSPDLWDAYAVTFAYPIAKKQQARQNNHGEYDPITRAAELMRNSGNRGDYNPFDRS